MKAPDVRGAIFDVDETLLANNPQRLPGQDAHNLTRLEALHIVGDRYDIPALRAQTPEGTYEAYVNAPTHTMESAIWQIFLNSGLVHEQEIDPDNELLLEVIGLKDGLYIDFLLNEATEVPGASRFVSALADSGGSEQFAIASTALRRDVDLFLGNAGLNPFFPASRIKTKEDVRRPKPHPEVFKLAFESLDLPESALPYVCAFEDDPRGIEAAAAAGLYVCAITTRFTQGELMALATPPHQVADSYAEFTEQFDL